MENNTNIFELSFDGLCSVVTVRLYPFYPKDKEMIPEGAYFKQILDLGAFYFVGDNFLTDKAMSLFGVDIAEMDEKMSKMLFDAAIRNTKKKHPAILGSIDQLLGLKDSFDYDSLLCLRTDSEYGAAAMLYPNLLQSLSKEMDSDFYVLPSSVHELIIVKADEHDPSVSTFLPGVVQEVNNDSGTVKKEEFLSDNAYLYDKSTGELTIIEARDCK